MKTFKHFKIYKPYGVLSQFTKEIESHKTLGDLYDFPPDVYPIGRLDRDSEGLLLLSNDKRSVDRILNPKNKLEKTYYVQVEGLPNEEDLAILRSGVRIKVKTGKYHDTAPCKVRSIPEPVLPEREPPIRFRKNTPTQWLSISISEGKNRQVRKMFAKIGYPVLRLVRYSIDFHNIKDMTVAQVVHLPNL